MFAPFVKSVPNVSKDKKKSEWQKKNREIATMTC